MQDFRARRLKANLSVGLLLLEAYIVVVHDLVSNKIGFGLEEVGGDHVLATQNGLINRTDQEAEELLKQIELLQRFKELTLENVQRIVEAPHNERLKQQAAVFLFLTGLLTVRLQNYLHESLQGLYVHEA